MTNNVMFRYDVIIEACTAYKVARKEAYRKTRNEIRRHITKTTGSLWWKRAKTLRELNREAIHNMWGVSGFGGYTDRETVSQLLDAVQAVERVGDRASHDVVVTAETASILKGYLK